MTAPTCTDCGTDTPVHVVMKPCRDKLEWWLCGGEHGKRKQGNERACGHDVTSDDTS